MFSIFFCHQSLLRERNIDEYMGSNTKKAMKQYTKKYRIDLQTFCILSTPILIPPTIYLSSLEALMPSIKHTPLPNVKLVLKRVF